MKRQFDIASSSKSAEDGMQAFLSLRAQAKENGIQDMTIEEINDEIQRVRSGNADA